MVPGALSNLHYRDGFIGRPLHERTIRGFRISISCVCRGAECVHEFLIQ